MRIAQISDTHIESANPEKRARIADLAAAVDSINALSQPVDVVLHTGDIPHDATAQDYAAARSELARLKAPLFTTIGNRDRRAPYFEAFAADGYLDPVCGYAQYALDFGGLYLVAVDTQDEQSALGGFCEAREKHLRQLLATANGRPVLVFAHHPPLDLPDMKPPSLQYRDGGEAARLVACLEACPTLVAVVTGHVHRTRAVPLGGVSLTTVPCIAADLSREKIADKALRQPIYHILTVEPGRFSLDAVRLEAKGRAAA